MHDHQREALQRVVKEKEQLSRLYRLDAERRQEQAFDCPEGPRLRAMLAWIATLGIEDAAELVDTVAGEDWLLTAPKPLREWALHLIGLAIEKIRQKAGMTDLDDGAVIAGIDEETNAFLRVKRLLKVE